MTVDSGHDFDVVVIGGGTAGMTAAREIARGGKHVALVEQRRTGGECLHTGCVPSKTFLATAKLLYRIGHAGDLAVDVPQAHVDFDRLKQRKDAVIDRVGAIDTAEALESDGVRVFSGAARFTGSFSLDTGSQVLTARQFVLATGSRPAIPPIEGLHSAGYLTHESILDIDILPERLAVIGAGATGLELGQAFARFGSRVTVIDRSPGILPGSDVEVADVVLRQLRAERIDVFLNATVDLVRTEEGGKLIRLAQQDSPPHFVEVDQILVATGRVPASDGLGLDIPGVETDNGRIIVDGRMQTTASHIWACGDVVGPPFSTHVADDQARTVASNILGSNAAWNSKAIPTTIFTDPEIAIVGLNEEEARSEFGEDLEVLRLQFQDIDRAVTDGTESGLVKVLLVPGWNRGLLGGEVAGAHVAGERAGEILQQFAFLMRWRLPVGLLAKTIQSYPTYSLGGRQVVGQHWLDPQVRWGMESPRNRIKDWFADKLDRSS